MVIKTISSLVLVFFLAGCSISNNSVYNLKNKEVLTLGKKAEPITIKFETAKYKNQYYFKCVEDSYTILGNSKEYGDLFVEYISLYNDCHWTGLPNGFLISNIKSKLKLDDLEIVEEYEINGYNFNTLKTGKDEYFSLIYNYNFGDDVFIIDYKGLLYHKLLKSFKSDYKDNYLNKKRFMGNYEDSLVRKNLLEHYFEEEREDPVL